VIDSVLIVNFSIKVTLLRTRYKVDKMQALMKR